LTFENQTANENVVHTRRDNVTVFPRPRQSHAITKPTLSQLTTDCNQPLNDISYKHRAFIQNNDWQSSSQKYGK